MNLKEILLSIIIILLMTLQLHSQSNLMIVNTTVGSGLTVCENDVSFDINIENPSPFAIANDTVTISLPPGVFYFPGSINNGVEVNVTDQQSLVFVIPDIPSLTTFNFSIDITASCQVESFLQSGGQLINDVIFDFDAVNNSGSTPTSQTSNSNVYSVFIPNLAITSITNQSYNAVVGDVFNRCISIVNGGSGSLSQFSLLDEHSTSVLINSISLGAQTTVPGGDEYLLSSVDFLGIGNGDAFFDPGETVIICETVEILTCQDAESIYTYWWGCSGDTCQAQTDAANILFPGEVPNLQFTTTASYERNGALNDNCYGNNATGDFESLIEITNIGSGIAYDVEIDLFQGWTSYMISNYYSSLNTGSFTIQLNNAAPVPITFDTTMTSTAKPCLPTSPIGRVIFTIDSILPTDTVTVNWNHFTCCHDYVCSNGERKHLLGWRFEGVYRNSCFEEYLIPLRQGIYTSYYRNTLILDGSPGTLLGSSSGTVSFLSSNWEFILPRNTANDQFIYQVISPPCLSVDVSSFQIIAANGTLLAAPDSSLTIGDTTSFYYSSPVGGVQAVASFDILLDCGTCSSVGVQTMEFNTFYTPDLDCNCQFKMGCETANIEVACPTLCEGANLTSVSCLRKNYGLADNNNDGMPDATPAVMDMSLVRTDRLMYGDTLVVKQAAYVHNPNSTNWSNVIAQTTITDVGTKFTYEGGLLTIYDASNLSYYNCISPSVLTTITTGQIVEFTHDIDLTLLSGGCLPGGFAFEIGDSVIWEGYYSVTTNIGGASISSNVENNINLSSVSYSSTMPSTDLFGCNDITKTITLIGYYWTNYGYNEYTVQDCNQFTITQNYYLSIGPCCSNYAGGNLFPFEYRHWGSPNLLTVVMPDDYTYISAQFNFVRTTGTLAAVAEPWFSINPSTITGNQYDFDVSGYFGGDPVNDSILFGDDGFHGTLQVTFEPNCNVEDTTGTVGYYWTFDQVDQLQTSPTNPASNNYSHDKITYIGPVLTMQTNLVTVNTSNGWVEWDITLSNTSNAATGSNLWLGAPTINSVTADSLYSIGTNQMVYPNGNGFFDLNQIGPSTITNYTLYTHITSCQTDSINLYFGWGCSGVPIDIASYECQLTAKKLTITPLFPEIDNVITIVSNDTIALCSIAEYELTVRNFQLGDAFNIFTDVILPSGLSIVPGSCQFSYNSGYSSISDPVFIGGTTFQWNINSVSSILTADGLKGIYDPALNFFKIKFQVSSTCAYTSGERIYVQSKGEAFCGAPVNAIPEFSEQLFIADALPPYEALISLGIDFITPCSGGSLVEVSIINQGSQTFSTADSITINLWPGITYASGSFIPVHNSPTGPVSITNLNGNEQLSWPLSTGVAVGDSTSFTISLNADPSFLECGIVQIGATSTTFGNSMCNSSSCDISVVTGDTTRNIFIYKAYLDLSNASGTSLPNPPNGEIIDLSFDIFNSGETIASGSETIIQFYNDDDGNGVLSASDTYITNDTIYDELLTNNTFNYSSTINFNSPFTCQLIAVIDTSLTPCICQPQQILIQIELWSPIDTFYTCSGEDVVIGQDSINGYNYSWQTVVNLSDSTIAQPIFNATNVYPNTDTLYYIRDIQKIGCNTQETSMIVLFSNPIANAGLDQSLCDTNTTNLTGNTPLGTSTGQWSEDTNFGNPSVVTFADSSISTTSISGLIEGNYQLLWNVSNGNCTPVTDTVVIHVYDRPVADAGFDQSLCDTNTTNLNGNTPLGTSTGQWSEDVNFGNPSTVTFADSSVSTTSISGLIEGSYRLLWTVSNGTCTPVTDTVVINVYDQLMSNAGLDQNLCATYTSNLSGNIPLGTSTGQWSEDVNFGNPLVVLFTDSSVSITGINGLVEGSYQLLWTVSNGNCTPVTDTVQIHVYDQPVSDAGLDQSLCATYTTSLTGNIPFGTATGQWSEDANFGNPSTVTFAGSSVSTTNISGLVEGSYQLLWTVSNGNCTPVTDTVIINVHDQPVSNAGLDQSLCATYTASLIGNTPLGTSTGQWSEDANFGNPSVVMFTDSSVSTTSISGLIEGSYQLLWTVSNGNCPPVTDTVVINVYDQPMSNAGLDKSLCATYTTNLAGNTPLGTATGQWSEDANFGNPSVVMFTDSSVSTTSISGLIEGSYQLLWTVSNGNCPPVTDTVVINVYDQPVSNAGFNQSLCATYITNLTGNIPLGTSTGQWSENANFVNPSTVTFADSSVSTTGISGLIEGSYQLIWTVSNGTCTPVTDTVVINVYDQPVANAGFDQDLCDAFGTSSSAVPLLGTATGVWELDLSSNPPGPLSLSDSNSPNTSINDLQEGTYLLTWTVSNGNCPVDIDTLQINVYDLPLANAGQDIYLCDESLCFLNASGDNGTATGFWSIDPGFPNPTTPSINDVTDAYPEVNNLMLGNYQLIWTVENGTCPSSQDTVLIINQERPVANAIYPLSSCDNECFEIENISVAPAGEFITSTYWVVNDVNYADDIEMICLEDTGTFNIDLTVEASNGCVDSLINNPDVIIYPSPIAGFEIAPEKYINELQRIDIVNVSSNDVILFDYNMGNGDSYTNEGFFYFYENAGDYEVTQLVENQYGCVDSTINKIQVNIKPSVFIPNSFTPNNDGINDEFGPITRGLSTEGYSFLIFDRWGGLLFSSTTPGEMWNGIFKNKKVQDGVYVWKLYYRHETEVSIFSEQGHIIVLK